MAPKMKDPTAQEPTVILDNNSSTLATSSATKASFSAAATAWQSPFSQWTDEDWKTRQFPTRSELKAVIPEHCFERSALTGFYYIARDLAIGAVLVLAFYQAGWSAQLPATLAGYPLFILKWFVYAILLGGFPGGLWVMGHECGHGAFSDYPWLNDLVGWVLHSCYLVPYFSWQFSHAKHHRRTNDLMEGETHMPTLWEETDTQTRFRLHQLLGNHVYPIVDVWMHLTIFFPLYFFGLISTGRKNADGTPVQPGTWMDHFRPNSKLFPSKMHLKVLLSDLGLLLVLGAMYYFATIHGFLAVALWYYAPVFVTNHVFLVYITWLQHTHPTIPHFGQADWTWVKGALVGTVDRPNQLVDFVAHHIGSTHICHHLFHEIPFYHAIEATRHLRAFLEPQGLYNFDPCLQVKAVWLVAQTCHYMDSLEGVQYYKSFAERKKQKSL